MRTQIRPREAEQDRRAGRLTGLVRDSVRPRLLHLLVYLLLEVLLLLLDHLQLLPEGDYRVARRLLRVTPPSKVAHDSGHHRRWCASEVVRRLEYSE